ncbi:MAG TPA: hypothetical protein VLE96_00175 [Chlamydiales bacterium]|nr:hypothetical protein [Chlamydiales bacterium]
MSSKIQPTSANSHRLGSLQKKAKEDDKATAVALPAIKNGMTPVPSGRNFMDAARSSDSEKKAKLDAKKTVAAFPAIRKNGMTQVPLERNFMDAARSSDLEKKAKLDAKKTAAAFPAAQWGCISPAPPRKKSDSENLARSSANNDHSSTENSPDAHERDNQAVRNEIAKLINKYS